MQGIEQYEHHGNQVFVQSSLKGTHREHCLCYQCDHFHPGELNNCGIAQELYGLCVRYSMVTPVFECPEFAPKEE